MGGSGLCECTTSARSRPSAHARRGVSVGSVPPRFGIVSVRAPAATSSLAIGPSGGAASEIAATRWPRRTWPAARSSATRSWPPTPNDDSTWTIESNAQHTNAMDGSDPLAGTGISLADGEVRAECTRIARRLSASRTKIIGPVPADDRVAVPPLAIHIGNALCDLTGATVAVVDANVRYPGLSQL